jgi:hypothetical protein
MSEHVRAWLETYHDGELRGRRLREVEAHLTGCAACREELAQLQALTALLRSSPAAIGLRPTERFVGQVGLRLPRRPERSGWERALETGWRLTPWGLLGAWAVLQTTFVVVGVTLTALDLGLGGDLVAGLLSPSQGGFFLGELSGLSGAGLNDVGGVALRTLGHGGPLGWSFALSLALLAAIGLLYWSWLASWWVRCQRRGR